MPGRGTGLGAKGNFGVRFPSGLMPGNGAVVGIGAVPGSIGKEGILGWLSEFVGD